MKYDNIVYDTSSVIDVLKKLDKLINTQTVFIIDKNDKLVGTITDGDIRRALIRGKSIEEPLSEFYFKDFKFLREEKDNFEKFKAFRHLKLKAVPLLDTDSKLKRIYDFSVFKSILPIDAVIMAGGKGERLRPLTNNTPKPLLKVGNKEIISYNIDRLHQYGISKQFITANYLAEQLDTFCNNYNDDIDIHVIKENNYLGTAGSLSLINNFTNDTILLMNSDLLTNIDYEDLYKSFIENGADMLVASVPYQVNLPYAILETNDKSITSFKEKPNYTYYANSGIYLIKKEIIELVPEGVFYNATDLMDKVVELGKNLMHYPIRSYWLDIGKPEDFEKAQKDIAHIKWD